MANTSKFNRTDVLTKASTLFWGKGFAGTSIRDIQDTVNMRPGSLYATFGSKEGLFKEALTSYTKQMSGSLDHCIGQVENPIEGLKSFVSFIIIDSQQNNPSGICMLYKASGEFMGENQPLFDFSQSLIQQFEKRVIGIFTDAKQLNFLDKNFDEANAGQQFIIQFTGLRNYFNGRNDPKLAHKLIEKMFTQLQQ